MSFLRRERGTGVGGVDVSQEAAGGITYPGKVQLVNWGKSSLSDTQLTRRESGSGYNRAGE